MNGENRGYWEALFADCGASWNRFWFTPVDLSGVARLRWLTGLMACWFLAGYSFDLTTWFGVDGLLPREMVRQITADDGVRWDGRASILNFSEDSSYLYVVHAVGLLAAIAFTVGFATRISGVALLLLVLSYVHRGPMVVGLFEPVLTFMLGYLCLTPCGQQWSVDAWWTRRRRADMVQPGEPVKAAGPSLAANVGQRLMQVHVAAFYAMMGLTKLAGDVWWTGEAMWWLIAHPESRLVDLTFLHRYPLLLDFWTQSAVLFELSFGILIWNRWARPMLLVLGVGHWFAIALVTGQVSFAAMMVVASLSFLPAKEPSRPPVSLAP